METIVRLRNRILEVALRDGMGHIPSALSILDIIWVLYDRVMSPDDVFLLSKGHGVMALYAVLEEKGLLDWSGRLMGHPRRGGAILASTGSLGHGLPMAVGLAMAKKIKGEKGRVFCLVGDGECNEGTTWESAMVTAHHRLNLCLIVDQNKSSERALSTGNLGDKFQAFGWQVREADGHDHNNLSLLRVTENDGYKKYAKYSKEYWHNKPIYQAPFVMICNTVKGNGVPFMQENSWHNRKLNQEDYERAIK